MNCLISNTLNPFSLTAGVNFSSARSLSPCSKNSLVTSSATFHINIMQLLFNHVIIKHWAATMVLASSYLRIVIGLIRKIQWPSTILGLLMKTVKSENWCEYQQDTQTCLEIFQGRVTAPRSHAVISMDLLTAHEFMSPGSFWLSAFSLKKKGRNLKTSLCPSSVHLNSPDRTLSKNLVLLLYNEIVNYMEDKKRLKK